MTRFGYTLAILAASVLASACTDELKADPGAPPPGSTTGGSGTTFDHDNDTISAWDLLQRLTEEGPPRFTSHMHSCSKVRYRTLGTVLSEIGVNMSATGTVSAAVLYKTGDNAMGSPNYENRIRENIGLTTSGASREFDIFAAAAPEVIAAFDAGSIARCPGALLFDSTTNQCRPDGIECLIGAPATATHLDYCNLTVAGASSVDVGKQLAVAAMLAAAYTCE